MSYQEMRQLLVMLGTFNVLIIEDVDVRTMITGIMHGVYKRLRARVEPPAPRPPKGGAKGGGVKVTLKAMEASALRYVLDRLELSGNSRIDVIYKQTLRDRLLWDVWKWQLEGDHELKWR